MPVSVSREKQTLKLESIIFFLTKGNYWVQSRNTNKYGIVTDFAYSIDFFY
jgi:hypothetical protein